jgi:RNA polymerase sigma factor (sigma-70 family)
MNEMSETELLQAFRKERSEEAFAELVRRYAALVYSVAHRRLSNAALAEDITQLVFIRFAKTPPKVQSAGELAAWLHRTTVNVTIDTWRSETRRRNREQQAAVMQPETNATTHVFWDEISPGLDEAIDQLNDDDRQAILLRFFKAKPMRDVGAALGVSEAAAKMRVGRAVDRLRTQLGASAAATTAVVLAGVLAERSAEAAPVQLVSRLAAMKLPAASVAGKGAVLHSLSRISKAKVAVGVVGAALVVISILHFSRPGTPVAQAATQSSDATATPVINEQHALPSAPALADEPALAPPKSVRIQFHVLDAETGAGLPQTRIRYVYFGAGGRGEGHDTSTDDKGDAAITEPDDFEKKWGPNVFVTAEGYVPKSVNWGAKGPPTEYTMRLDPAATANGFVVDEEGQPVTGVRILIETAGNQPGQSENIDFQTCPITNRDDGSWSCSYIPKDTNYLQLKLKKAGYEVTEVQVQVNTTGLNNLVLVIGRGYSIAGKVADEQGRPIANALIKVLNRDRDKPQSTHSDQNGLFTLQGVSGETAPGAFYQTAPLATNANGMFVMRGLVAQGSLHADLAVQADGFAAQHRTVELSATNVVDFALLPGNVLAGRVVDERGNPIANAVVQTDYDFIEQVERSFDWNTHTDSNGWFQWDSAPAQKICYWIEADGYFSIRGRELVADGSEHRIVLTRKAQAE